MQSASAAKTSTELESMCSSRDANMVEAAALGIQCDRLRAVNAELAQWLAVVLDQVDYTAGACSVTEMVGACLDSSIIVKARATLAKAAP